MRISTQMMYEQSMRGVTNSQSAWLGYGEQMATGQKVNRPSDDPIAASQAVVISQAQAQNTQYETARTFAKQKVSLEESVLQQVTTAITGAQGTIVKAGNGSLSDDDRASLATELQGYRDQLLNLANSTDGNGRYIFGGYKTESAPYDATGTYSGGNQAISQQVDASRTMVIAHTGNEVFNHISSNATPEPVDPATGLPGTSETDLFKMLDTAITALKTPVAGNETAKAAAQAVVDKTSRGLGNSLNNVSTVRAELGTQLNELDTLDALGDDRTVALKQQKSDLIDVDWNSVISAYTMQQAALQASYKAFTDMQGLSLFQMNK
ncbi:flagellar hook-associated protein FlgL [Kosakonia sacchari]|uniref:flagellar hook-associated protein FlgL n=1 Tax=Kosakonia sacchari TaxID=1158459 RepID=UPI003F54426D